MASKRMTHTSAILTATVICLGILAWQQANAAGNAQAGEQIFNRHCKDCHETGVKGAPRVGDKAAWAERIQQGELLLTQHAFFGHRKMPTFGNCSECNKADFADAVAYMVSKSK
jgi:cytochrome c5